MQDIVVLGDVEIIYPDLRRAVRRYGIDLFESHYSDGALNVRMLDSGYASVIPHGCTVIVDSADSASLHRLSGRDVSVITCGTAASDTLSLSSSSPRTAAVSLLRSLVTADGTVEPCEIPITLTRKINRSSLLTACALLLLLGIDCSDGYMM